MRDPIRPRFPLYHMGAGDTWAEEIRQQLAARYPEACFVGVAVPTGYLVGSLDDLRQFYPQLADQLGEKSPKELAPNVEQSK
jgi:hypothetical protein